MKKESKYSPEIEKGINDFYKEDRRIRSLCSEEENNDEKLRDVLSEKVREDIVDLVRKNSEFIKNINIYRKSLTDETEKELEINHYGTYSKFFYRNFIGFPNLKHFFEETKDAINCIESLVRITHINNNDNYDIIINNIFSVLCEKINYSEKGYNIIIKTIGLIGLICRKIVVSHRGKTQMKICMKVVEEYQAHMFITMFFNALGIVERFNFTKMVKIIDSIFDLFHEETMRQYLLEDYINPISNMLDTICYQYDKQMADLVEYYENKEH